MKMEERRHYLMTAYSLMNQSHPLQVPPGLMNQPQHPAFNRFIFPMTVNSYVSPRNFHNFSMQNSNSFITNGLLNPIIKMPFLSPPPNIKDLDIFSERKLLPVHSKTHGYNLQ